MARFYNTSQPIFVQKGMFNLPFEKAVSTIKKIDQDIAIGEAKKDHLESLRDDIKALPQDTPDLENILSDLNEEIDTLTELNLKSPLEFRENIGKIDIARKKLEKNIKTGKISKIIENHNVNERNKKLIDKYVQEGRMKGEHAKAYLEYPFKTFDRTLTDEPSVYNTLDTLYPETFVNIEAFADQLGKNFESDVFQKEIYSEDGELLGERSVEQVKREDVEDKVFGELMEDNNMGYYNQIRQVVYGDTPEEAQKHTEEYAKQLSKDIGERYGFIKYGPLNQFRSFSNTSNTSKTSRDGGEYYDPTYEDNMINDISYQYQDPEEYTYESISTDIKEGEKTIKKLESETSLIKDGKTRKEHEINLASLKEQQKEKKYRLEQLKKNIAINYIVPDSPLFEGIDNPEQAYTDYEKNPKKYNDKIKQDLKNLKTKTIPIGFGITSSPGNIDIFPKDFVKKHKEFFTYNSPYILERGNKIYLDKKNIENILSNSLNPNKTFNEGFKKSIDQEVRNEKEISINSAYKEEGSNKIYDQGDIIMRKGINNILKNKFRGLDIYKLEEREGSVGYKKTKENEELKKIIQSRLDDGKNFTDIVNVVGFSFSNENPSKMNLRFNLKYDESIDKKLKGKDNQFILSLDKNLMYNILNKQYLSNPYKNDTVKEMIRINLNPFYKDFAQKLGGVIEGISQDKPHYPSATNFKYKIKQHDKKEVPSPIEYTVDRLTGKHYVKGELIDIPSDQPLYRATFIIKGKKYTLSSTAKSNLYNQMFKIDIDIAKKREQGTLENYLSEMTGEDIPLEDLREKETSDYEAELKKGIDNYVKKKVESNKQTGLSEEKRKDLDKDRKIKYYTKKIDGLNKILEEGGLNEDKQMELEVYENELKRLKGKSNIPPPEERIDTSEDIESDTLSLEDAEPDSLSSDEINILEDTEKDTLENAESNVLSQQKLDSLLRQRMREYFKSNLSTKEKKIQSARDYVDYYTKKRNELDDLSFERALTDDEERKFNYYENIIEKLENKYNLTDEIDTSKDIEWKVSPIKEEDTLVNIDPYSLPLDKINIQEDIEKDDLKDVTLSQQKIDSLLRQRMREYFKSNLSTKEKKIQSARDYVDYYTKKRNELDDLSFERALTDDEERKFNYYENIIEKLENKYNLTDEIDTSKDIEWKVSPIKEEDTLVNIDPYSLPLDKINIQEDIEKYASKNVKPDSLLSDKIDTLKNIESDSLSSEDLDIPEAVVSDEPENIKPKEKLSVKSKNRVLTEKEIQSLKKYDKLTREGILKNQIYLYLEKIAYLGEKKNKRYLSNLEKYHLKLYTKKVKNLFEQYKRLTGEYPKIDQYKVLKTSKYTDIRR